MIPLSFYQNENVVEVAKALLGKLLLTQIDGELAGGYISETEAYAGIVDRACHAYNNRRTERTEVMYKQGGVAYVYLCYGIHHLLNVVTAGVNIPHAVLIRALEPAIGQEIMLKRRGRMPLTHGPGALTRALGITLKQNGKSLSGSEIWIEEGVKITSITAGPRIGVDYAGPDAHLPYRFIGKCAIFDL
ncbi:MAG: DNA-3-methyladenine glycosylase [Parachlamydiales bacterium]|nr:DNA-3-methyladenine glycosylase [Parachlamydiales bacterium]